MRQVSVKKYDTLYYENNYFFDYSRKVELEDYGDVPKRMSEMLSLKKTDNIIDFGCGVGSLIFYLSLKYKCNAIGIDYSKDAIKICQKNKKKFVQNNKADPKKITFFSKSITELPAFKNIKAVYLQDVIEHLYDEEIYKMLEKFKTWNKNEIYLILHTDNNLYLQYIRPFEDLINLFLHKTTKEAINRRTDYEAERHINLITVNQAKRKLLQQGFVTEKVEYSTISYEKIQAQLKKLWQTKPILQIIYYSAKLLFIFRPSFYLLAKYNKNLKIKQ